MVAITYVPDSRYIERAGIMLLEKKRFISWVLGGTKSPSAKRMIKRLKDNPKLKVTEFMGDVTVSLK